MPAPSPNLLLVSLSSAEFELLGLHLRAFQLVYAATLAGAGDPLACVYFPYSGVIFLADGGAVGAFGGQDRCAICGHTD
jgi:hypothetical protein